jgi:hypothetical protein
MTLCSGCCRERVQVIALKCQGMAPKKDPGKIKAGA